MKTIEPFKPRYRGRGRAEDAYASRVGREPLNYGGGPGRRPPFRLFFNSPHPYFARPQARRVSGVLSRLELLFEKSEIVVRRGLLETKMLRIDGLYYDARAVSPPSGPAACLRDQLKRALRASEVRHVQRRVAPFYAH